MCPSSSSSKKLSTSCSENHCVEVNSDGTTYVWATNITRGNRFGQLGRRSSNSKHQTKHDREDDYDDIRIPRKMEMKCSTAAAGGSKDSGHTLLVDEDKQLYACGCDRWQQLGLGSTEAGAAGYTWKEGKLWQYYPQKVHSLSNKLVIAVEAGADHSVALLDSGEVWTWGRGEHGQLGQQGKPFVMPPTKSAELSSCPNQSVRAIRAEGNCTAVFVSNENAIDGDLATFSLLKSVGRCSKELLDKWKTINEGKKVKVA